MAHSLSAKKRIRQGVKRNARNRARKATLKNEVKVLTAAITTVDTTKAAEAFKAVTSRLAKLAGKHTIHKNTAARRRSRMAKKVNALASAQAPVAPAAKAPTKAKKAGSGTKA